MTRINLLIPLFDLNLTTNNPQIITSAIKQKYPDLQVNNVYWLDSQHKQGKNQSYQCVVRSASITLNLEEIIESLEKSFKVQETISQLKNDLFNFVKVHEKVLIQRDNILQKLQAFKTQAKDQLLEDVSLKIEEKSKKFDNTQAYEQERQTNLNRAVSELTRQNIRLKDMLSYYQAQIQYLSKRQEELVQAKQDKK